MTGTTAERRRTRTIAVVPSSDKTSPGRITTREQQRPNLQLRCTVGGCGWKRRVRFWLNAQSTAFQHAAMQHLSPGPTASGPT